LCRLVFSVLFFQEKKKRRDREENETTTIQALQHLRRHIEKKRKKIKDCGIENKKTTTLIFSFLVSYLKVLRGLMHESTIGLEMKREDSCI